MFFNSFLGSEADEREGSKQWVVNNTANKKRNIVPDEKKYFLMKEYF
jgi:hypothetical protein